MTEAVMNDVGEVDVEKYLEPKPAKNGGGVAMLFLKFSLFVLGVALVGVVGGAGGYYAALSVPAANQVMVLDLDKVMKDAADKAMKAGGDPKRVADEMVNEARAKVKEYTDMGVIVIDRASVIDAPKDLFIRTTGSSGTKSEIELQKELDELNSLLAKMKVEKK